jgi:hypothetical protein
MMAAPKPMKNPKNIHKARAVSALEAVLLNKMEHRMLIPARTRHRKWRPPDRPEAGQSPPLPAPPPAQTSPMPVSIITRAVSMMEMVTTPARNLPLITASR